MDSDSVESLLKTRRGKEGRVLWAPIYQHKPRFEFWYVRMEERKFLSFSPKRAPIMVSCMMSPIGKIHLLPSLVQCRTCCANLEWEGMSNFVFMY